MPVLRNGAYEKFCQLIASGKTRRQAFLEARDPNRRPLASDASVRQSALSLMQREDIKERIAELRGTMGDKLVEAQIKIAEKVAEKVALTLEKVIAEANAIQEGAMAAEQYSAAVAALTAKAKLAGLWIEKAENLNTNYAVRDEPFTESEWQEQFARPN